MFYLQVLDRYVTTAICILGCIGNTITLVVLSIRKQRKTLSRQGGDSGATAGLITLATSEFLFCLVLIPRGFISSQKAVFPGRTFWLYYQAYSTWLVTTFIITSTWVTVTVAAVRYLAICKPFFYKRVIGTTWLNTYGYLLAFIFGCSINIPSMWQYNIDMLTDDLSLIDIGSLGPSTREGHVYLWVRATIAFFIPGIILVCCNISLIAAVRRSQRMRQLSYARRTNTHTSYYVTTILIAIATAFIVLVIPSELIDLIFEMVLQSSSSADDVRIIRFGHQHTASHKFLV